MATALYKLGRMAFRRRKAVLAVWLVLLGGMFAAAATLSGPTTARWGKSSFRTL